MRNGKRLSDIKVSDAFNTMPTAFDSDDGKKQFMYPEIASEMLFNNPFDCFYCIGKTGSKGHEQYVGIPYNVKGAKHILITGQTGAGKSATQITNNLLNFMYQSMYGNKVNSLVLDPKGELYELTGKMNPNAIAINPFDRVNGYGFNPFCDVTEKTTNQELYDLAYIVTISLIPKPSAKSHDSGPWISLAQDMLLGFIIYSLRYKKIINLPDVIKYMLSRPMEELIEEVCDTLPINDNAYMSLIQFKGMSPETLYSVTATLFPKIKQFATDQNLVYTLAVNKRMFKMSDLLTKSVYIVIPLDKIQQWGQLIYLIINLFSLWLFSLDEKSNAPERAEICMVLDETTAIFQALGNVPEQYPQLLRYGRSFGFTCITAVQSLAGLKTVLDDASVDDLLSNMPYKIFLDCSTESKMLIDWVGKYPRKHVTYNGVGKNKTTSITFSDDDILSPSDAQKLGLSDELICISSLSGYSRIKKNPWYQDKNYLRLVNTYKRL